MRYDGADGARRRRVTQQLGEAVYAALGLMVREYLGAEDAEDIGAEVNGSFDTARYLALRGEASVEEPVRETEAVSRAGEAAEVFSEAAERSAAETVGEEPMRRSTADGDGERAVRETVGAAWRERRIEKRAAVDAVGETAWTAAQRVESGAESFYTAARLSEEIERDARRYDGGVYLS